MRVTLIAALAQNRVIGRDNALPWHLPDDMKHFREQTTGHHVVMGRRTFESMGRPLPRRTNIVLSTRASWGAEGVAVARDTEAALTLARQAGEENLFVIGGETIYEAFWPSADAMLLTRVDATVEGDVRFPEFDESNGPASAWQLLSESHHASDARHLQAFRFQHWERRPAT